MKKIWIMAIATVVLLIGSFPARDIWGTVVSDIMRLAGFALLIVYLVKRKN